MKRQASQRILGIDPGSRATGFGIIEKLGQRLHFVACGVIRTERLPALGDRLRVIHERLALVIEEQCPDVAAIEDMFVAVNPGAALKLGHARGVAILAAVQHGLAIHAYAPRLIKQAVVGYGQAEKGQIQQMVRVLLNLSGTPSRDAADALAVAICHAHQSVPPPAIGGAPSTAPA